MWKPIGNGKWVGSELSDRFNVYTRGNAGEVYPEVFTPLSFSIAMEAGEAAMRNALLGTGLITKKELEGVGALHCGWERGLRRILLFESKRPTPSRGPSSRWQCNRC